MNINLGDFDPDIDLSGLDDIDFGSVPVFSDYDTDGDGVLNDAEYASYMEALTTWADATGTDVSDDTYVPPEQTVGEVEELVSGLSDSDADTLLEGMEAADRMVSGEETSTDWFYDLSPVAQAVAVYVASGGNVNLQSAAADSTFVDMNGAEYQVRGTQDALATLLGPFLDPLANISNNPLGALAENRSRNATARAELRDKRQFINRLVNEEGYTREQARHIYYDYLGARDENPNKTLSDAQIDQLYSDYQAGNTPSAVAAAEEAAAARQAAITNAGNIFSDLGYDASNAEKEQFADNPDGIADYVNPRQVTAQEAAEIFQRTYGYEPNREEIEQFMGQGGEGFEASQQEAIGEYVDPRHISLEELEAIAKEQGYDLTPEDYETLIGQAEGEGYAGWGVVLNEDGTIKDYGMQGNVISQDFDRAVVKDEDELREIASNPDVGFDISDLSEEEIADLIGGMSEQEVADQLDPLGVSTKELGDIARQENFDLANLSGEELAQLVGNNKESDIIQDIDSRATTVGELQEVYKQRTGNELSAEEAQDMLDKAIEANDGTLTEEQFEEWVDETIETNFKVQLQNLGQNILDIIFGKDPATGKSKTIQQIWEEQRELLFPPSPSDPDYERKYTEWLKRQVGGIISINHDPKEGIFAGVRFPVPIPVSGPEIIIPLFDEDGKYIGGNVAQVLLNEAGDIITETGERIGQMTGNVIQIFDAAGEVVHAIPLSDGGIDPTTGLPVLVPAGWEEGDANPWEVKDSNGDGVIDQQVDADGNPVDPDTGLPIQKEPEDEDEPPPDAEDIEEGAYDGVFNNDVDGDGVSNEEDAFPNDPDEWADTDADGVGDNADVFPEDPNETVDTDADGVGDNSDLFPEDASESIDTDGDGVGDNSDLFPEDASESIDTDGDGVGDNADVFDEDPTEWADTDEDGVGNNADAFPEDASESIDTDGDGVGDNSDLFPEDASETVDTDGDGVGDNSDLFPEDASETLDTDGDGVGDNSDLFPEDASESVDTDGDGVGDSSDAFPEDANESVDTDGDGVGDNTDAFPENADETLDTDADGVGDNQDAFPEDANESIDTDGDGVGDNTDAFPDDNTENVDTDGDGVGDNQDAFPEDGSESLDSDKDGVGDNADAFPTDPGETIDTDGDGVGDNTDEYPEDDRVTGLEDFATQQDVQDAKDDILSVLNDPEDGLRAELTALGLSQDEIRNLIGDPAVADDPTTEEDESRPATGLYELIEAADNTDDIEAISTQITNLVGTPEYAEDGTTIIGGTGLYGLYDETRDIKDVLGEAEYDDAGNLIGGTGLYGDLYSQQQAIANLNDLSEEQVRGIVNNVLTEVGLTDLNDLSAGQVRDIVDKALEEYGFENLSEEDVQDIIGRPSSDGEPASGIYEAIENLNDLSEDDVTRIVGDIVGTPATDDQDATGLFEFVGEPAYDEDGNLTADSTGLYLEFYNAGLSDTEIKNLIGTPDNPETDENEASGLYLAYQQGTESTQNYIDDVVNPQLVSISDRVGTPDDPDTEEDETSGLYLAVQEGDQAVIDYIGAPEIDPETGEIVGGTGLYADLYALGLDTDRIIELIGDPESETGLYGLIGSPAIPDDPNTPEDESRPGTGVYGQIDAFAGDISDQIDTSQEETNQYLDYISGVIGRPASDLTQDDVDMVIDLLAEDEFISDFNNDMRLYDVNFDGQIDQSDIGLLQGFVDAGVEGIGEIPATGIYADAARRQEEITGSIADQAGETRELIGTEAEETRRIVGQQNLFNALLGSGDLMGRQVDVTTPDPVQLKYIYDFSDIFATPQQRGLFPSPYGAPQRQAAQQVAQQRGIMSGPLNLGGLQGRPGMAAGGKVDYDFTDEIMHIMSYGDS